MFTAINNFEINYSDPLYYIFIKNVLFIEEIRARRIGEKGGFANVVLQKDFSILPII